MGLVIGLPAFFDYFNISLDDKSGNQITGGIDSASLRQASTNKDLATNGLYSGGGIIGCVLVPYLLDRLGRRLTIQLGAIVAIASSALQAGSVHIVSNRRPSGVTIR